MATTEALPETHDSHGHDHDHDHPAFLAHHFDTPEQQFDSGKLGYVAISGHRNPLLQRAVRRVRDFPQPPPRSFRRLQRVLEHQARCDQHRRAVVQLVHHGMGCAMRSGRGTQAVDRFIGGDAVLCDGLFRESRRSSIRTSGNSAYCPQRSISTTRSNPHHVRDFDVPCVHVHSICVSVWSV